MRNSIVWILLEYHLNKSNNFLLKSAVYIGSVLYQRLNKEKSILYFSPGRLQGIYNPAYNLQIHLAVAQIIGYRPFQVKCETAIGGGGAMLNMTSFDF